MGGEIDVLVVLLIWTPAIHFVAMLILTGFDGDGRTIVVRLAGTLAAMVLLTTGIQKLDELLRHA